MNIYKVYYQDRNGASWIYLVQATSFATAISRALRQEKLLPKREIGLICQLVQKNMNMGQYNAFVDKLKEMNGNGQ